MQSTARPSTFSAFKERKWLTHSITKIILLDNQSWQKNTIWEKQNRSCVHDTKCSALKVYWIMRSLPTFIGLRKFIELKRKSKSYFVQTRVNATNKKKRPCLSYGTFLICLKTPILYGNAIETVSIVVGVPHLKLPTCKYRLFKEGQNFDRVPSSNTSNTNSL